MPSDRPDDRAELRSYYEREAAVGARTSLRSGRLALRQEFIDLLRSEGRTSVIDFGAGPGLDGEAFVKADLQFVGIDLAVGNGVLARRRGVLVVSGSIDAPPIRSRSFDSGWSMSTLMHLDAESASNAVAAIADVLVVGSPFLVGLWGGPARHEYEASDLVGCRRPFHLRPVDENRRILAEIGRTELHSLWDTGPDDWEYQVFLTRVVG